MAKSYSAFGSTEIKDKEEWTVDDVRRILKGQAKKSGFLREDSIDQLEIQEINKMSAFAYQLETFLERRKGVWRTEPYSPNADEDERKSNRISGGWMAKLAAANAVPENFWKFEVTPLARFDKAEQVFTLPGTTSIYECPPCEGSGKVMCGTCRGEGKVSCKSCRGFGTISIGSAGLPGSPLPRRCPTCLGNVQRPCSECRTTGIVFCKTCHGHSKLKSMYEMKIFWEPKVDQPILSVNGEQKSKAASEYTKILKSLQKSKLQEILSHSSFAPEILSEFPDVGVQIASKIQLEEALKNHQTNGWQIIEFRQIVHKIEMTSVNFSWRGTGEEFIIYGPDDLVYFPKSFSQNNCCCYCCSIL